MNTTRNRYFWAALPALALATGCETNPPGAGLTNGPAPRVAPEKPALRSDLPIEPAPDQPGREAAGRLGDATHDAGTGGRGAGDAGGTLEPPSPGPGSDADARANPTATPGSASGGTRPPERIETGNPRGPH